MFGNVDYWREFVEAKERGAKNSVDALSMISDGAKAHYYNDPYFQERVESLFEERFRGGR